MSALFFDIDGTILSDITHEIPESALEALKKAQENGHKTFINTGRTVCSIPPVIKNIPFDGFLCGCGTHLVYGDEVIFHHSIPYERGREIIQSMKNCKVEGIAKAMKAKKIIYAGTYKKPENKKLMKSKCDLAILSNKILPDEKNEKKMSVEDQQKRYEELAEKFVLLDIPMIVDRSADEKKDDAKEEWSKVYEAIFAQTDSADSSAIN